MRHNNLFLDLALGLVAGAVATFVMDKVGTFGYKLEDPETREYEENLRGKEYPPEVLAKKVVELVAGESPTQETAQQFGMGIHWVYGMVGGGILGALRSKVPGVASAGGLSYDWHYGYSVTS